jgi:carbonic anhydrase
MRNLIVFLLFAANAALAAGPDTCSVNWSYDRTAPNGPARWGTFPEYDTCSLGEEQTPVDLSGAPYDPANPILMMNPDSVRIEVEKLPYTLEVLPEASGGTLGTIELEGAVYDILQFHFHGPSEHLLRGRSFPLEMHWVARRVTPPTPGSQIPADLAVFGVMIAPGAENVGMKPVIALIPSAPVDPIRACPSNESEGAVSMRAILAGFDPRFLFTYRGSLTTPPCTQGVRWIVASAPLEFSQSQIDSILRALPVRGNARPRQPLHGRTVTAGGKYTLK